jgi:exodeoxyribonuclease I
MAETFYFYDTETSGTSPKFARIMQFAGQRLSLDLQPIGQPDNILIKLTKDILPDPEAILVHGLSPQVVNESGISEPEFFKYFLNSIAKKDTIFVGFNNIRFDDEFIRYGLYRNLYDPYEWHWGEGRSRWDLLDVARMTRALRPDGIKWPFDSNGSPTVRLEYLTKVNKLSHDKAHDALGDVVALIELAKLFKKKQPKLFDFLFQLRTKQNVAKLIDSGQPFVYSSGKYPGEFLKTAIVTKLADHPKRGAFVYDLRHDPSQFINLSASELKQLWRLPRDSNKVRLPVKALLYNRCPAVAPLGVIDDETADRIKVDLQQANKHYKQLRAGGRQFVEKINQAVALLDSEQASLYPDLVDADVRLYDDGFWSSDDKSQLSKLRNMAAKAAAYDSKIGGKLGELFKLYRARYFEPSLTDDERKAWEDFRLKRLLGQGNQTIVAWQSRFEESLSRADLDNSKKSLLMDLKYYAESLMPYDL